MKFLNITWIKIGFLVFVIEMMVLSANAQTDFISPYSIFGPGIAYPRQGVTLAGMGGSGAALFDLYRLNLINPAVAANHAEPIFEFGGRQSFSRFTSSTDSEQGAAFKINNLSLSFPLKRNIWNLSLGVVPSTIIGYEVSTRQVEPDLELDYLTQYRGEGGIAQAYLGSARKIINRVDSTGNITSLSLGGNLNYNFGSLDRDRILFFPDDLTILGFHSTERFLVRDVTADFGIHYHTNIIKRTSRTSRMLKLLLGATYTLGNNLNTQLTSSSYSFRPTSSGFEQTPDTIVAALRQKGSIHIPAGYSVGVGFDFYTNSKSRYRLAIDYRTQQWTQYSTTFSNTASEFRFEDSHTVAFGLEFTPDVSSQKVFERIEYRAGYRTESTNLNLRNTPINEYGISFGLSLPIHYRSGFSFSTLNIATEYGEQGTNENGLIKEQYMRIFVGFSLTPHFRNRWFVKPKYD